MLKPMKIFLFSFLFILCSQCVVFNETDNNADRILGTLVASKITNAAILADLVNTSLANGQASISILTLLADRIAGINRSAYYYEPEVDACTDKIRSLTGFVLGSTLSVLLLSECDLEPDRYFFDSPFPEL